mgnify:CR=1 FL=1
MKFMFLLTTRKEQLMILFNQKYEYCHYMTASDPAGRGPPVDNLWITNVMYLTPQMAEII